MHITHLPHLLEAPKGPARRLADRLIAIVEAVTTEELEQFVEGVAACPQHPRRCGRAVFAARTVHEVRWACGACLALGVITGWEGTAFDQRRGPDVSTPMPASALTGPMDRWPKASGNFTTFAKPVIDTLQPVPDVWRGSLRLPETVWNAVVMEDFAGRSVFLDDVRRAVAGSPVELFVDVLVARKRRLFAADWRVFRVSSVELRGGTMWVHVDAKDGRGV